MLRKETDTLNLPNGINNTTKAEVLVSSSLNSNRGDGAAARLAIHSTANGKQTASLAAIQAKYASFFSFACFLL